MPYIPQRDRERLEAPLQTLFNAMEDIRGEYVYLVYRIARRWMDRKEELMRKEPNYVTRSNAASILTDANDEFRRQYLSPYEDERRRENGPV